MTTLKVKIQEKGEWKEVYVEVPNHLYNDALTEKKQAGGLDHWCLDVELGHAEKYWRLYHFIEAKLNPQKLDQSFERIHIIK